MKINNNNNYTKWFVQDFDSKIEAPRLKFPHEENVLNRLKKHQIGIVSNAVRLSPTSNKDSL